MRIANLWDKHRGNDIVILGTGPSSRCFDKKFFENRIIIGLNQAYRLVDPTYSITVHPELYLEWRRGNRHQKTQWIVKKKNPLPNLELDDPLLYVFETNAGDQPNDFQYLETRTADKLYQGRGVQVTAMCLAAHMGARSILMVGCDMCKLGSDHHGVNQHVRFNGLSEREVYAEYRRFTAKARRIIREKYGIPVVTISPFVGVGHPDEDYARLQSELRLPDLPPAKDTSKYKRKAPDQ